MAKINNVSVEKTAESMVERKETFLSTKNEITVTKNEAGNANAVLSGLIILSDKISSDLRAKVMKTKIAFSDISKSIEESREMTMKDHKVNGKLEEEKFFETFNELMKEKITLKLEAITNEEFDILLAVNTERKVTSSQLEILMMIFDKLPK